MPSLWPASAKQALGQRHVAPTLGQGGVVGLEGGDVVVLADHALAAVGEAQHGVAVGGGDQGAAHADVVERRLVGLHPHHQRLRRLRLEQARVRDLGHKVELADGDAVQHVRLPRRQRRHVGGDVGPEVDVVDLRRAGGLAPVAVAALEAGAPSDLILAERIRTGADRVLRPVPALLLEAVVHDRAGEGVELFGQGADRPVEVQDQRVVVDHLHA